MITITTGTKFTFTGEQVQLEIEKTEERINFVVRSNEFNNQVWKPMFTGTVTPDEVRELKQGIEELIKKTELWTEFTQPY